MELYRIESDDMARIPVEDLDEEQQLENRLVRTETAQIGGVEILYIGRQGTFENAGVFDILGIDEAGNTVVVELKRDNAPRSVITQALEYASEIRNASYEHLDREYEAFLREEQGYEEDIRPLREAHADYFEFEEPLSDGEFNNEQRLILVADEFEDDELLSMADFLREHGIDVIAVEYNTFRDDEQDIELLSTDAIRRPLSEEPSGPGSTEHSPREWEVDGREWHLNEQTNPDTSKLLKEIVAEFNQIESLQEPRWAQQKYIAFHDDTGKRRLVIRTQATQLQIKLREPVPDENEQEKIASNTGIATDAIQQANPSHKAKLVIYCKPEDNVDIESLRNEVEQLLFTEHE
jgi:hypothetical protein